MVRVSLSMPPLVLQARLWTAAPARELSHAVDQGVGHPRGRVHRQPSGLSARMSSLFRGGTEPRAGQGSQNGLWEDPQEHNGLGAWEIRS